MKIDIVDHHAVQTRQHPFGEVITSRGTATDLIAQIEIERGEDGRRGANRFAQKPAMDAGRGGVR